MTIREMQRALTERLTPAVGEGEARAMANIIIEDLKGYTPTQLVIHGERQLLDETAGRMLGIADRVAAGEPLQYVIGTARFRGRDFRVTPDVLIPRPETGQLVDMIVDAHSRQRDLRVLDLGCGSGCIAVSLALDLPYARATAVDISPRAVEITRQNAQALHARVEAIEGDIFALPPTLGRYQIIVSNPPYIMRSEAAEMDPRVKDHEPALALYVPDAAPTAIYEAIADYARGHLDEGGTLYLEINPLTAGELRRGLRRRFGHVDIVRDYKGNERFAIASTPL